MDRLLFKKNFDQPVKVVGIASTGPYSFIQVDDQVKMLKAFTDGIDCLKGLYKAVNRR